eukprot:TRINITY_DN18664_c0_g1_i1.p1 TRINITY_DN18664_c0_g1~~TRINITY_DN18664_c0_g1_i1.p1  ORF type:complete len:333 (-),score=90.17 TRINITY_DN18664_c0_g1_i1:87-1028(-)
MYRLALLATLVFHLGNSAAGFTLVWNCAAISYNGTECNALMSFDPTTGLTSTLADLSAFPLAAFMAADTQRQVAYVMFDNGTLLTTGFDGSSQSLSSGPLNGAADVVDLIVDENSGALFALLEHERDVAFLTTLELVKVDAATGNTVSVMLNKTDHTYFLSSSFSFADTRYFAVFASDDSVQLVTMDIGAGSMSAVPVPYGLTAIAYSAASDSVYGLVSMAPMGTNTLVSVDLATANVTTIGQQLNNTVCGTTLLHGGLSTTQPQYATLCCDTSECSNVTSVTVLDMTSNAVIQSVVIPALQIPASGFFTKQS